MPEKLKDYLKSGCDWFACRIKVYSQEKIINRYYSSPDIVGEVKEF